MSNSSRIEVATRQHVGATLTSEQIVELVKVSDPTNTKGVYPSDCAYSRTPEGLVPRGKVAYGDGVLEYLGANSFKVLATQDIVRRPGGKKPAAAAPAPAEAKPVVAGTPASGYVKGNQTRAANRAKKPTAKASQIPVATKQKAREARV
jgi:hypothetical protein